jgi:hypothetical protein
MGSAPLSQKIGLTADPDPPPRDPVRPRMGDIFPCHFLDTQMWVA